MHKVCLEPIGKELEVNHDTPLRDIVAELGLEFPCGGNGFCGNCGKSHQIAPQCLTHTDSFCFYPFKYSVKHVIIFLSKFTTGAILSH